MDTDGDMAARGKSGLTLASLDAMSTDDLKTVRKAVGLVLSLRGESGKKKPKK